MGKVFEFYCRAAAGNGDTGSVLMLEITNLGIGWNRNQRQVKVYAQVKNVSDFTARLDGLRCHAVANYTDGAYDPVSFEDLSFISLDSDISPGSTISISKSAAFNPALGTQGDLRIAIEPHGFVPSPESTLTAENTWINVVIEG